MRSGDDNRYAGDDGDIGRKKRMNGAAHRTILPVVSFVAYLAGILVNVFPTCALDLAEFVDVGISEHTWKVCHASRQETHPQPHRLQCRTESVVLWPIVTQWYGMREFAIEDPDGYVITFAERLA